MKLYKIKLDEDNRMLRAGFGKFDGRWFARVDLWSIGLRLTTPQPPGPPPIDPRDEQIKDLKRKNLELSRVYEERGRQIGRLELALRRATK